MDSKNKQSAQQNLCCNNTQSEYNHNYFPISKTSPCFSCPVPSFSMVVGKCPLDGFCCRWSENSIAMSEHLSHVKSGVVSHPVTLQARFQFALSAHMTNNMHPSGADSKGVVLLGDSAGAHFHIPPEWMTVTQMSAVRDHVQPKPLIAICFLCCAAVCQGETSAKCFTALEFVVTVSRVSVPSHTYSYEDKKSTALCCCCSSDICATGLGKSLAAVSWCCARDTNQDIWLSMHMPAA